MLHKNSMLGDQHIIHNWEAASSVEREALSVVEADIGKVCFQVDNSSFYILSAVTPSVVWTQLKDAAASLVEANAYTDSEVSALSSSLPSLYQPLADNLSDIASMSMVGQLGKTLVVNATEDGFI